MAAPPVACLRGHRPSPAREAVPTPRARQRVSCEAGKHERRCAPQYRPSPARQGRLATGGGPRTPPRGARPPGRPRGRRLARRARLQPPTSPSVPQLPAPVRRGSSPSTSSRTVPRRSTRSRLYDAPPGQIIEVINETPDEVTDLLVIGHNPGMQAVAELLAGTAEDEARGEAVPRLPDGGRRGAAAHGLMEVRRIRRRPSDGVLGPARVGLRVASLAPYRPPLRRSGAGSDPEPLRIPAVPGRPIGSRPGTTRPVLRAVPASGGAQIAQIAQIAPVAQVAPVRRRGGGGGAECGGEQGRQERQGRGRRARAWAQTREGPVRRPRRPPRPLRG